MITGIFFYVFAAVLLFSGAMTVFARNPVHAVLFLILAFFNASGLFLLLGAEFLALILLIVYVGAVAVLFLFAVMLLDLRAAPLAALRRERPVALGVAGLLLAQILVVALRWPFRGMPLENHADGVRVLGRMLTTDYALVFQLSGLILLVAITGAIALAHTPRGAAKRQDVFKQIATDPEKAVTLRKVKTGEGAP